MMFSVGEDLFSVMVVVGLVIGFTCTLAHCYHLYMERKNLREDFGLALEVAGRVRTSLAGAEIQEGLIYPEKLSEKLEEYSKILEAEGTYLRVELRGPDGGLLAEYGEEPGRLAGYFSPPCSISLPVVVARSSGREVGRLVVFVDR